MLKIERTYFVKPFGDENNKKIANFLIELGKSPEGLSSTKMKINGTPTLGWELTEGEVEQIRASKEIVRGIDYEIFIDLKNGAGLQKFPKERMHTLTKKKLNSGERKKTFQELKGKFMKNPRKVEAN